MALAVHVVDKARRHRTTDLRQQVLRIPPVFVSPVTRKVAVQVITQRLARPTRELVRAVVLRVAYRLRQIPLLSIEIYFTIDTMGEQQQQINHLMAHKAKSRHL
jgi:hypothetical protein